MLLDVCDGVALGGVRHQDVPQQVLAALADRDAAWKVVVHRQDALQDLRTRRITSALPALHHSWLSQHAEQSAWKGEAVLAVVISRDASALLPEQQQAAAHEGKGTFWNLWGSPASSARSKGYSQNSITYSMTPLLHTSASLPSYVLLFAMTSGAAHKMAAAQTKDCRSLCALREP